MLNCLEFMWNSGFIMLPIIVILYIFISKLCGTDEIG